MRKPAAALRNNTSDKTEAWTFVVIAGIGAWAPFLRGVHRSVALSLVLHGVSLVLFLGLFLLARRVGKPPVSRG